MRKILLMLIVFCGLMLSAEAQQKTITGTVTSSVPEEGALPGVSVSVKGTTVGITTDINGKFSLAVPSDASTLVLTFIGMKRQEIEIGSSTVVDVIMEPELLGLNEVVVTAFGVSRAKKALGYAVQDVKYQYTERAGGSCFVRYPRLERCNRNYNQERKVQ
jgi:hypothetical protein